VEREEVVIGVDTNVLLRFLTNDEPAQYAVAERFFRERSADDPAFISSVTLAEAIWVLRGAYHFSATDIGRALSILFSTDAVIVEGREKLETAQGTVPADRIADHLVAHLCTRAGCSRVVTFDRRAARDVPGMELIA
jgi:predicted nucleic-acid-binding protein